MLNFEEKKQIVADINQQSKKAQSMIVAHYRGLTVDQINALRKQAVENNVKIKVIKNTLAKIAIKDTQHACLTESLSGPVILAFSMDDPGSAARIFKDFVKENKALEVKALSLGSELIDGKELNKVASLPTYDQSISLLMGVFNAPITKLTRTFNDIPGRITRVSAAVKDQKQA